MEARARVFVELVEEVAGSGLGGGLFGGGGGDEGGEAAVA